MTKKGSVTVFLALVLSLMLSLICTSVESVRMAAARTQILGSLDIGLYSLFGQYDSSLLKEYDLFFLDGSCGGGMLHMAGLYDNMKSYMEPVLKQNSQKLSIVQGGFTGYRLATDEEGEAFYHQIVQLEEGDQLSLVIGPHDQLKAQTFVKTNRFFDVVGRDSNVLETCTI